MRWRGGVAGAVKAKRPEYKPESSYSYDGFEKVPDYLMGWHKRKDGMWDQDGRYNEQRGGWKKMGSRDERWGDL